MAFDALPLGMKQTMIANAQRRARDGKCFLCRYIVEKKQVETFPEDAKKVHLMLCSHPDAVWNRSGRQ